MKKLIVALFLVTAVMSAVTAALADAPRPGTLSGRFVIPPSTPMSGGLVYFYNLSTGPEPSYDRYWRVPDYVRQLDKEGRFSIELAAGDYSIGAVKRNGPQQIGPPREGDLFLLNLDDKGRPRKVTVKSGDKIDMGVISGERAAAKSTAPKVVTAIEGVIQDEEGKPLEGALVLAYLSPTIIGKPLFVSDRSGKDGRFLLRVHEGGTFYIKFRGSFGGGPPRAGAMPEGSKEEPLQPVTVKTGETVGGVVLKGKLMPGRGRN